MTMTHFVTTTILLLAHSISQDLFVCDGFSIGATIQPKSVVGQVPSHSSSSSSRTSTTTLLHLSSQPSPSTSTSSSSKGPTRRKPLSPEEILQQQRERQGLTADDDAPKLFEDDVLDVMQQILLLLEKRAKDGPGSLSATEVDNFVSWTQIVEQEMKNHEYNNRLKDASPPPSTPPSSATAMTPDQPSTKAIASSVTSDNISMTSSPVSPPASGDASLTTSTAQQQQQVANEEVEEGEPTTAVIDTSNDEGPAYDGTGGLGMAKGTRNTYVIDGMDEMSPEEYQKALQDTIIRRAEERKASSTNYGNRATWDYLNNLNGASGGPLRSDIDSNDDDEDIERP